MMSLHTECGTGPRVAPDKPDTVDAVFQHDRDMRIVSANQAYLDQAGAALDQVVGHPYWQVFPRRDGPLPGCAEALRDGGAMGEDAFATDDGRQFVSRSFPVRDAEGRVAGGFHLLQDVSARHATERALRESEDRYRTLFETMDQGVVYQYADGRIGEVNPAAERILGLTREQMIGRDSCDPRWRAIRQDGTPFPGEQHPSMRALREGRTSTDTVMGVFNPREGDRRWILVSATPEFRPGEDRPYRVYATFTDITERVRAERALTRANRALRTLSAANRAIAHAGDEAELQERVCRLIVDNGYRFAWVGYLEDGPKGRQVRPRAQAGAEQGYLKAVQVGWGEDAFGGGPTGRAARSGRPQVSQDIARDPHMAPWREAAVARGFASAMALPLKEAGTVFGVLVLYAAEVQAFVPEATALLEELAADLAFGLHSLRINAARNAAENLLHVRNRAIEAARNGIMIVDARAPGLPLVYVNPAFGAITGYSEAEVLGRNPSLLQGADRSQPALERIRRALADQRDGVALLRNYRKDGSLFWNELQISPVRDAAGAVSHYVGIINDVTAQRRYEQELEYHAYHDQLTGLPNRHVLHDRLTQALLYARRHAGETAVLFLDIDRFKVVNEGLGHSVGDALLVEVARRLQRCAREEDTVCRYGGDEFVVVLAETGRPEDISGFAGRVREVLAEPVEIAGHELRTTASVGVCIYPRDGEDAETLLRNADAAMYRAKELGRNRLHYYTAELNARVMELLVMGARLRKALEDGELLLHYQPQVDLRKGRVVGVEALVRWQQPEAGLVGPAQFIPLAEETGLILPLGDWVLREACRQATEWQRAGLPPVTVAVNLSPKQLDQDALAATVAGVLEETGLDPQWLELELTESAVMRNPEQMQLRLDQLKALGLKLSIDDFGTGYSSLAYLSRFPFDKLKIDQSFVRDIVSNPSDASIAATIVAMAENLGLRVIAEGVETEPQLEFLRRHRCDEIQGYFFSPPLPAPDAATLLRRGAGIAPPRGALEQPTLLVLDDEVNITRALHRLLRRDFHVLCANDTRQAFELLALHPVQVVIADQRMPDMSGTEFFARVKELYPDVVRMILSGYTDLKTVTGAVNRGWVYKFLTKPWEDDELRRQVEDAFRHHARLSGAARRDGERPERLDPATSGE